jgi:hypothetical protein
LTETPSACYFAIWDGRGNLTAGSSVTVRAFANDDDDDEDLVALEAQRVAWQRRVAELPRFEHPDRSYLLGRGPIGLACDLDRQPLAPGSWQTLGLPPQIWWPEDRAWVVGSEIDFNSTIVATTNAGAEALLTCEGLEVLLVPSDGRLDIAGDVVNGQA